MKKLLIIEDEYSEQGPIAQLCEKWPDQLELHVASNERQAIKILLDIQIEIIICDLSSGYGPRVDNLANLMYRFPYVPSIAIISKDQQLEEHVLKLGTSACLTSPPVTSDLRFQVHKLLEESKSGNVRGIPVHSLLQMFEGDEKTCTLRVESKGRIGLLFMDGGVLVAAETEGQLNEDAVYSIVAWEDAVVEILHYNRQRSNEIQQSLLSLIIEAFRLKDERESFEGKQRSENKPKIQLQHFSTAGNRISIEMGAKIKMEIEGVGSPITCTMVGMIPNQYLVITAPNPFSVVEKALKKENKLIIKYLHLGRLCMFRTKILDEIHSPQHLLFLDYPPVIHYHELRQARRTTIFVPSSLVFNGERELSGVLVDLSSMGCLFLVKDRGNSPLPNFDIDAQVELRCLLPGVSESRVLLGRVRNIKKTSTELRLGIQFRNLSPDLKEAIENYVVSVESFST
jgi:c-di-GMP-binding flagellar brake protein YcgR